MEEEVDVAGAAEPSVDEIISTLKKTSLPTILVEGKGDVVVYRKFEERLGHMGVSVLPVGGRQNVLAIFQRRNEIPSQVQLSFFADQDTWIYSGVPPEYVHPQLVLTCGYSIENDVFEDGALIRLLDAPERLKFDSEVERYVEWYSLAVARFLNGKEASISLHPNHVLDPKQRALLLKLEPGEQYPEPLRGQIHATYAKLLRGKSLMALLLRLVNAKGRASRHNQHALLEMVAIRPGPLLSRMAAAAETALSAQT